MILIWFMLILNSILFILMILFNVFAINDQLIIISIVDEIMLVIIMIFLTSLCTFISNYVNLSILIVINVFKYFVYHVDFNFMY